MGKLLKFGGLAWAFLGVLSIVGLITVATQVGSMQNDSASGGIVFAALLIVAIFIFPGLRMAYRGHKLLQGDARVAVRTGTLARKLERDDASELWSDAERADALPRIERPCPYCAEMILAAAVVCKHCGRDVPRRELGIRG